MVRINDDVGNISYLEGYVGIEVVGLEYDNWIIRIVKCKNKIYKCLYFNNK